MYISSTERYVCLADGRKIPFKEYQDQSRDVIRSIAPTNIDQLLGIWIDRSTRRDLRSELTDRDIHVAAFRHYLELDGSDDVDILGKVGFEVGKNPFPSRSRCPFLGRRRELATYSPRRTCPP